MSRNGTEVTYEGHRFLIEPSANGGGGKGWDVILIHEEDNTEEVLADGFRTESEAMEAAREIANDL